MNDEIKYVFTLWELRNAFREFFYKGEAVVKLNSPKNDVEAHIDGWLELNGSDFQLENEPDKLKVCPYELIPNHETDLGDDISSDSMDVLDGIDRFGSLAL